MADLNKVILMGHMTADPELKQTTGGTSVCSFCAQMLAMVSLPFYLQTVLGRSEVETGLLLTPWPLATMVMAPLAGYLIERVHAPFVYQKMVEILLKPTYKK